MLHSVTSARIVSAVNGDLACVGTSDRNRNNNASLRRPAISV